MVASGLDGSEIEGVLGTVAGDDTVLVICKQGVNGRSVERRLRGLADSLEEVS
jgi:transcriptional regulator of arginine metabolism